MQHTAYWGTQLRRLERWTWILAVIGMAVGMLSYMTVSGVDTPAGAALGNEGQRIDQAMAVWLIGLAVIHLIAAFARGFIEPKALYQYVRATREHKAKA